MVRGDSGRDPFNQNSDRSDREKWSTSKGGPVFSKLFRLDRTDPLNFGPKFPEILVEWIAPSVFKSVTFFVCGKIGGNTTFYFEKEEVNLGHTGNISPFIQPSGVHLLSTSLFSFYKRTSTNPPCSHLSTTATSLY